MKGFTKIGFDEKSGIHKAFLGHGTLARMVSDPAMGPSHSFQRRAMHQVPTYGKSKGARWNVTFRSAKVLVNAMLLPCDQRIVLGEGLELHLLQLSDADDFFDELKAHMAAHASSDRTFVYGKWHDNKGRMVMEYAHQAGAQYSYSGKTTTPGIEFGKAGKRIAELMARDFGVPLFFFEKVSLITD